MIHASFGLVWNVTNHDQQYPVYGSCATKFIKLQTLRTASKLSEIWTWPLTTLEEGINNTNIKEGLDGETLKRIKTDRNCGFWKLFSLTVFQSSFCHTFNIILVRHICWSQGCYFVTGSFFTNVEFHSERGRVMANIGKINQTFVTRLLNVLPLNCPLIAAWCTGYSGIPRRFELVFLWHKFLDLWDQYLRCIFCPKW